MGLIRRPLQGAINILSFNRHFYVLGLLTLFVLVICAYLLQASAFVYALVFIAFGYGLLVPLLVSAYVYDLSGFYKFNWLRNLNFSDSENNFVVCINAGFDEVSFDVKDCLPKSQLQVYDFYDAKRHTEPAIVRARKVSHVYPNTQQISTSDIPLVANSVDYVFFISALHEVRNRQEKIQFLKECARICKPTARIVLVEHLRDLPNFLAFTIGFTHFFSKASWLGVFKHAGFELEKENKLTGFMSVFVFKKNDTTS